MTPTRLRFDAARHRYTLDGERIVGVTTAKEGFANPALDRWRPKRVAEEAMDNLDLLVNMTKAQGVDFLKGAPYRTAKEKARLGTAVHAAIAGHVRGLEPPDDLTDAEWGYFNGALRYFKEQNIEIVHSEAMVYNATHRYAGTLDLDPIVQVRGRQEIHDFKTSARIYAEVGLQLVAYARAEFMVIDGEDHPMPEIRHGVGIRLDPEGDYEAVPFELTDDLWLDFLAAKRGYHWNHGGGERFMGEPLRRAA